MLGQSRLDVIPRDTTVRLPRLLTKDHLLAGLGEEQDAHILSMVRQELSFLVARAPGSRLDLLLTYKK